MMTPKEVLLKAAEVMAERGQHKGKYYNSETGSVCAYGAMSLAATEGRTAEYMSFTFHDEFTQETKILVDQAATLLAETLPLPGIQHEFLTEFDIVTKYNDRDDVSTEDMVLAMKRVGGE